MVVRRVKAVGRGRFRYDRSVKAVEVRWVWFGGGGSRRSRRGWAWSGEVRCGQSWRSWRGPVGQAGRGGRINLITKEIL